MSHRGYGAFVADSDPAPRRAAMRLTSLAIDDALVRPLHNLAGSHRIVTDAAQILVELVVGHDQEESLPYRPGGLAAGAIK